MWGAGESDLFEIIEMDDAQAFIEVAASFYGDLNAVFDWVRDWVLRHLATLEVPRNEHNAGVLQHMLRLRLGHEGYQGHLRKLSESGKLYAFDPVHELDEVRWVEALWGFVVGVFYCIEGMSKLEPHVINHARNIAHMAREQMTWVDIERPLFNPISYRLVEGAGMDGVAQAWVSQSFYHGRSHRMIWWYRSSEHAHTKLAIQQLPHLRHNPIGQCNGTSVMHTNHAPSYSVPLTNSSCRYLYAFRAQEAPLGEQMLGVCDLVRFDLMLPVDHLKQGEMVIKNISTHMQGRYMSVDRLMDVYEDNQLMFSAVLDGEDVGRHLLRLDIQARKISIVSALE